MQLRKFKITTSTIPGYMMVTYHDNNFKSVLNEFTKPLTEVQLNWILKCIPQNADQIESVFLSKAAGKITVEPVKAIGAEPEPAPLIDYPVNDKIALFCRLYEASEKVKYKTGAAEAGKLKGLPIRPEELELLLGVYFKATEWYLKPKSISNFINKYNELRALAYAPKAKTFPLPFDELHYAGLNLMDQRAYHQYLRDNGYRFEPNPGRGGKWVNY